MPRRSFDQYNPIMFVPSRRIILVASQRSYFLSICGTVSVGAYQSRLPIWNWRGGPTMLLLTRVLDAFLVSWSGAYEVHLMLRKLPRVCRVTAMLLLLSPAVLITPGRASLRMSGTRGSEQKYITLGFHCCGENSFRLHVNLKRFIFQKLYCALKALC